MTNLRFAVAALLACGLAAGQAPTERLTSLGELRVFNGRAWNDMKHGDVKLVYLAGLLDEIKIVALARADKEAEPGATSVPIDEAIADEWAAGFTSRDYVKVLDELYAQPENVEIPVAIAVKYCTLKLKGERTAAEMENVLIKIRVAVRKFDTAGSAGAAPVKK